MGRLLTHSFDEGRNPRQSICGEMIADGVSRFCRYFRSSAYPGYGITAARGRTVSPITLPFLMGGAWIETPM
jgi:hypothetical protein